MANSTATTYTITNNNSTHTATINYILIDSSKLSNIQHHIDFTVSDWNVSTDPSNFTATFVPPYKEPLWLGDVSPINKIYLSRQGTNIYLNNTSNIELGWIVTNNGFTGGQTVTGIYSSYITVSAVPNTEPKYREIITLNPPSGYFLIVDSTSSLSVGNLVYGKGLYFPQTILGFSGTNYVQVSVSPSVFPVPGDRVLFADTTQELIKIDPLSSKTISMYYSNVTSTLNTYSHLINFHGTITRVAGVYNPEIEVLPLTNIVSITTGGGVPSYDVPSIIESGGDGASAGPGDCGADDGGGCS